MNDKGHNSVDASHLRAFLERVERLSEEKDAIQADIREVFAEAKSSGYDVKIMRKILARRRMDADKRREEEAILELYEHALGQLANTPLGRAAISVHIGGARVD